MSDKSKPDFLTGQLPLFEFDQDNLQKVKGQSFSEEQSSGQECQYIVYVDESGDHNLVSIDDQYPVFVLAFCVFHKRHYSEVIVPMLEKFKFNYFGHDQVVLHENEIRRRKGAFNIFKSKDHQQAFVNDLTEIIKFGNFVLISATIDKTRLKNTKPNDNAYHIALKLCMETLYEFLAEKCQESCRTHIVVECRGAKEDKELELEFLRICGNNKFGTVLPYEVLFADKKVMSSGLQLADLVARPIGLNTIKPDQENRAFEVLKEKFYCEGGRACAGKGYEGVGMKIYPTLESEKPR